MQLNAHGCGVWRGWKCPNNAEAFEAAVRHGYRNIEVDVSITADGVFVIGQRHADIALLTEAEFMNRPAVGGGTPLSLDGFLRRLEAFPALRVMFDFHPGWERDRPEELKALGGILSRTTRSNRFLLEAYSQSDADAILQTPFKNVILWMANRARRHAPVLRLVTENAAFCLERGIRAVSAPCAVVEAAPEVFRRLKEQGVEIFSTGWDSPKRLRLASSYGVDVATVDFAVPHGLVKSALSRYGWLFRNGGRRILNGMWRRFGRSPRTTGKRVFLVGVFDMLHYGHFELFRRAKALSNGGRLTVAVQDDDYVLKYKPEARIVVPLQRRIEMISALRWVDWVDIYADVDEIVQEVEFDVFVVGGDQNHAGFQRAIYWCKAHGREVVRLPRTPGVSSTELRRGFFEGK